MFNVLQDHCVVQVARRRAARRVRYRSELQRQGEAIPGRAQRRAGGRVALHPHAPQGTVSLVGRLLRVTQRCASRLIKSVIVDILASRLQTLTIVRYT